MDTDNSVVEVWGREWEQARGGQCEKGVIYNTLLSIILKSLFFFFILFLVHTIVYLLTEHMNGLGNFLQFLNFEQGNK